LATASGSAATAKIPLATTATVVARATPEAARTIFLRTGLDDLHRTTTNFLSIDAVERGRCLRVIRHLNKPKTTRATRFAIQHDARTRHGTEGFESCTQLIIGERVAEVTDVEIH